MRKPFLFMLATLFTGMNVFAQTDSTRYRVDLDDVVVTGTRQQTDVRHLPMTVSIVSRDQLTEHQRVNLLPTLTEQVPGLFVTSRAVMGYGVSGGAAGGINLRGLAAGSGQVLVLIDGHPQYQGIYGHAISDSYQTLMAERVEVVRGPASVLYGSNAMGGVVNIVTRGMKADGVRTHLNLGVGSWGTIQAEASNQVRQGRFTSTAAVQYGRSDNHRPRMGFEQYGGYVKLGYDVATHWHASADIDLTHFNASYPGTVSSPVYEGDQWITRGAVSAAIENHYALTSGALSVYSNFGRHKINDGYREGGSPQTRFFRSRDAMTGLSWYQSLNLLPGNRVTVGLDYQHIYGRAFYTSRETGEVLDTPNKQSAHKHQNEVAGYVDVRQDISEWLTLDAGVRLDHHSVAGNQWVPQGGLVVRPTRDSELKAMVAKGFRNPTMREMYLYPPSNEELRAERLVSYDLSWRQRLLAGRLTYGVSLFYLNGDNLIQTIEGRNVNTGAIENSGIELEGAWRINARWSVNTNHSLLHLHNPVAGAPQYKGYAGLSYRQQRWNLSAGLQQLSGLYTATGQQEHTENATLLNLTASYLLQPGLTLWVKGDNLLAQRYEINQGYPMPRATFMAGVSLHF